MDKTHHASPRIRSALHQLIDHAFVSDEMKKVKGKLINQKSL
ncbi:hypothetical protein ABWW58_04040 [Sporolactobacillus sp. STCC-11]